MKDSTVLQRAADMLDLGGNVKRFPLVKRLREMATELDRQEKRDRGLECCESCERWVNFDTMTRDCEGLYFCPTCVKAMREEDT